MTHTKRTYALTLPIIALMIVLVLLVLQPRHTPTELFVSGLNQPRGMAFDDAGNLYVAEAGAPYPRPDEISSPHTNHSGRVVRIGPDRHIIPLVEGLPFTNYSDAGDVGVTDVHVTHDAMYILTAEGYDDSLSRSVLHVLPDQPAQQVANLLTFAFGTTPVSEQLASGGVPSNPYAMVGAPDGKAFYITDGASGSVLRVTLDGDIEVFASLPDMPPLTGLSFGPDGRLYIAMFSALPLARHNGAIWSADETGRLTRVVADVTMPIDVAFDAVGTMYVLEFSDGRNPSQPYSAASGRLLRILPGGEQQLVLDQLNYPTSMIFSPAGDLYIAVNGAFSSAAEGAILKVQCHAISPDSCSS